MKNYIQLTWFVSEHIFQDFYSHSYSRVTVMQVSVTNMSQVHGDLVKRSRTSESLRVLHEIISAFDKVSSFELLFLTAIGSSSCHDKAK